MSRLFVVTGLIAAGLAAMACGTTSHSPAAPIGIVSTAAPGSGSSAAATPPFNLEAVLRPLGGGSGFGLVKFRQPKDDQVTVELEVWLRDLQPTTSYSLQRAVDPAVDGQCTSTAWLTLGAGLQPLPIVTDPFGTGRASLFRDLAAVGSGAHFDIHFRVVETATGTPVLQSRCYEFVVSR